LLLCRDYVFGGWIYPSALVTKKTKTAVVDLLLSSVCVGGLIKERKSVVCGEMR